MSEALKGLSKLCLSLLNFRSFDRQNDCSFRTDKIFLLLFIFDSLPLLLDLRDGSRDEFDPSPPCEKELFCLLLYLIHTLYFWHATGFSFKMCSIEACLPSKYVCNSINTFLFKVSFPSIILENLQSIRIWGLTVRHNSLNSSG